MNQTKIFASIGVHLRLVFMKVELDHFVIAVSDWMRSNDFYARVLGAQIVPRGEGFAYRLDNVQMNVHGPGVEATPRARVSVVAGGSDLCFRFDGTIEEARAHLQKCGVAIELGPAARSGFAGVGQSLYFRDPDGSLLEFLVPDEATRVLSPVVLENEWVRLEPLAHEHTEALWAIAPDPRIYEHLPVRFESRTDIETFVSDSLARQRAGMALPFAIVSKAEGRVVGSTALFDFSPERRAAEIGWTWHTPDVWGTPINVATKILLLEHAFTQLELVRVYFKTDVRNGRSQRAIEKLGAIREGVWRKHMQRLDGSWRDSVFYSITDDDWPRVQALLKERLRV